MALTAIAVLVASFLGEAGAAQGTAKPKPLPPPIPQITKVTLSRWVLPPTGGPVTLSLSVTNAKTCWFAGMAGLEAPSAHEDCTGGTVTVTAQVAPSGSLQKTHLHIQVWAAGGGASVATAYAYLVENGLAPLKLTSQTLTSIEVGTKYTYQLKAQGGRSPYLWHLASGALPTGLSLSTRGYFTGTPTTPGAYTLSVEVSDSARPTALTATAQIPFDVAPAPLAHITRTILSRWVLPAAGGTLTFRVTVVNAKTCWFDGMAGIAVPTTRQPSAHGTATVTARVAPNGSLQETHLHIQVWAAGSGGTVATAYAYLVENGLAPLKVTSQILTTVGVGRKYAYQLTAQGGRPPYLWHLASGALPTGLTLSTRGLLAGTPTTPGAYTLSVEVSDSARPTALTATSQIALDVTPPRLQIQSTNLPQAAVQSLYNANLRANGGIAPYAWKWLSGRLPASITLSAAGVLSGMPTAGGTFKFGVQVADSAQPPKTATAEFLLKVTSTPLIITTKGLPRTNLGTSFSTTLTAIGGVTPYTWTVSSGQLPAGVTLSSSGVLSGTPSTPGTYPLHLRVTDSSSTPQVTVGAYSLVVATIPLSISTNSLSGGTVGSPYSATFAGAGGLPPYYWSISGGTPPGGLTLSSSGTLSGTPSAAGTFSFSVKVADTSSHALTTSTNFTLVIAPTPVVVATTALPAIAVGSPYAVPLAASGGTAPYTWRFLSGHLPAGITLSSGGNLAGLTTSAGTFKFKVKVTDSSPETETATASLTLLVGSAAVNWSGYVQTGTYTSVTGTFTVPTTTGTGQAGATPAATAEWVGLDGATSSNLIQAGVLESAGQITPVWEILPAPPTPIAMTVSSGDSITVTIFQVNGASWAITLDDNTTGEDFRTEETYHGPGTTADFIVEAPSLVNATTHAVTPQALADYSPAVKFSGLETEGSTSATAAVVLVQGGVQVSTPSVFTSSGFAVAYGSNAPAAP